MTPHDARLVPAAAAAWAASALAVSGRGMGVLAVGALVAVLALVRSARSAAVVAAVASAVAWAAGSLAVADAGPLRDRVGDTARIIAVAETDAAPGVTESTHGSWRVEFSVDAVEHHGMLVPVRANVTAWGGLDAVVRGDRLELTGRLAPASGSDDALMWHPRAVVVERASGAHEVVATLRQGLRDATAGLPERLAVLTRGMVIGDDAGMAPAQRDQLRVMGLSHLTAVSGAHFAIVLLAVAAALRTLTRSRRVVAGIAAVTMVGFTALVFPEPSVVRAGTMAAAVCLGLWWGRRAQALPALSGGVLGVAVVAPRLAVEPGFAMSVAAVAAIALWAPVLAVRLSRRLGGPLAHAVAVCVTAQLAVSPVLALIDGTTSVWAVVANLLAGWCAALVTLIGLAAVCVAPVSPEAATAVATLAGWCAWPVDAASRVMVRAPGAGLTLPVGGGGAVACAAVLAVAVALTWTVRIRVGWAIAVAVALLVVPWTAPVRHLLAPAVPGDWTAIVCDVGQGDAMLVRTGSRDAILVDAGPPGGAAVECLRDAGVTRVPLMVVTHPHADHEGGVDEVLAAVEVAEVWVSPAARSGEGALRAAQHHGVPARVPTLGETVLVGDVRATVLGPEGGATGRDDAGLNDASVVLHLAGPDVSVLALGDLEPPGQRALAARLGTVVVDVVKVAHHGSAHQDPALAARISARLAVVSVGEGNGYGHPAASTLELYGTVAGAVARTDLCGALVLVPGPSLAARCPTDMAG